MRRFAVLVVLVVACGGSSKSAVRSPGGGETTGAGDGANPIPQTGGPDCAVAADRAATVAHADAPDRQAEARELLRTHCVDDKWADNARSCFATVETDDEVHGCMKLLSDAQRDRLHAAAPADMTPKGGAPMSTSSPSPPPPEKSKSTRGPIKKNSSDPCEGGESK